MQKIDILNREDFVNMLLEITKSISNSGKSTSFAIDGSWGSGKSFVLDMFEEKLSQVKTEGFEDDRYFIIRYNCWEYDYYEEPLVAIVATMLDMIDEKTKFLYGETGEQIKGVLKAIGATLLSIANGAMKNTTGVDLSEAYSIVNCVFDYEILFYENIYKFTSFLRIKGMYLPRSYEQKGVMGCLISLSVDFMIHCSG